MGIRKGAGRNHLIPQGPETAFAAYESARARLPQAFRKGAGQAVETLAELAGDYDAFLLDAFGVLNIGEQGIPDVPGRIAALQTAGKRILVLSNAASHPVEVLAAKYRRLGYAFGPDDIVTSRAALLAALTAQPRQHLGIMTAPDLARTDMDGLEYSILGDDPAAYHDAEAFVMLSTKDWTAARQELLVSALTERPRPVWVGNPDIVAPRETGFSTEPGYYAHALADRTGIAPRFFGKPFANIYDLAFAKLGISVDHTRILMVGDTLHTDILGAQTAGVASALVTRFGFFSNYLVEQAIQDSGIRPDYILERP